MDRKISRLEQYDRNLALTKERISGVKPSELAKKYKMTVTRVNAIVTDTKAKYGELLN